MPCERSISVAVSALLSQNIHTGPLAHLHRGMVSTTVCAVVPGTEAKQQIPPFLVQYVPQMLDGK